ncbi:Gfo/Idh/MocA family oxidoreductase [Terriglobus aquaticus]|uniref:Gfo/Idh/MocA family oxidoreductase n=1 Tax=Terriglobus aquaticus TaxID=940139 RepID=A0ABW9KIL3_9BACT|nr:Gfo/Idh/MocA family oxidoreductase [Terriglobus aquaticus]
MGIRTGVIGFGLAGRVFHAPFVHAARGLDLSAIVQRTGDDAARAFPNATIFRSADDLVASDVELVVVGTPNSTHVPLARAALNAGKHVVIDKPFTPTTAEAEELEALAQSRGLLLAPFHNRRFDGDFLTVKKLLNDGSVGRPVTLVSRFDRFRPTPRANTWKEAEGAENGLLMDLGPHLVDQALVLFGRPESITADVRTDRDGTIIEDAFDITLHFQHEGRGVRVDLGSSMIAADPQSRFLLNGTSGSFRKFGVDPQEPAILAGAAVPPQGPAEDEWYTEDRAAWGTLTTPKQAGNPADLQRETIPTERGDYRRFYEGVAQAISSGATPPTTPRDAIRVARLLEMARESSRTGRTLAVPTETW